MNRPDEVVLQAIARMKGESDFQTFMQWLTDSYVTELKNGTKIEPDIKSRWSQGRAQQVEQILDTVKMAEATLEQNKNGGQ